MGPFYSILKFIGASIIAFIFACGVCVLGEWIFSVIMVSLSKRDLQRLAYFIIMVIILWKGRNILFGIKDIMIYALCRISISNRLFAIFPTLILIIVTINSILDLFIYPNEAIFCKMVVAEVGKGLLYYIGAGCTFIIILKCYAMCFYAMWNKETQEMVKMRNSIAKSRGMRGLYKILIDGLLSYHSARVIKERKDVIVIGGTFNDAYLWNVEVGQWTVTIQQIFDVLNVKYQGYIDSIDYTQGMNGKTNRRYIKETWEFPIQKEQDEMVSVIKGKIDELKGLGILI